MFKSHKHVEFPSDSKHDEDGVRNVTNMGNDIVYNDKTGLEDLTECQKTSFEITDGH